MNFYDFLWPPSVFLFTKIWIFVQEKFTYKNSAGMSCPRTKYPIRICISNYVIYFRFQPKVAIIFVVTSSAQFIFQPLPAACPMVNSRIICPHSRNDAPKHLIWIAAAGIRIYGPKAIDNNHHHLSTFDWINIQYEPPDSPHRASLSIRFTKTTRAIRGSGLSQGK